MAEHFFLRLIMGRVWQRRYANHREFSPISFSKSSSSIFLLLHSTGVVVS
ncbi:hypothetical protein GO283_01985 [Ralstonia solanacearum]|nr:hypothetical protein [Ralstonia solanacearum]